MNGPVIVNADDDEIEIYDDDDDDDGIIEVLDVPRHADIDYGGHIEADDDNGATDDDNSDNANDNSDNGDIDDDDSDDEDNGDEDGVGGTGDVVDAAASDDDVSIPGVRRSRRKNRGKTTLYEAYGLMMASRKRARGGDRRAIIRDGVMFFSNDDLNDAKPIPVEDVEDYVLGVALAQYSITAGLKKFKEKGEAGVTKELTQMHDMTVFRPIYRETLSKEERTGCDPMWSTFLRNCNV